MWTNVHINGPIGAVREDLTDRILLAMGLAPLDLAGKGVDILTGTAGGVGGTAVDVTKGVLNTGKDVIQGTGEAAGTVLEKGVDIIKGVFRR